MKTAALGIGLLIGGLLAVPGAQARNCCPGHRPAAEPAELAQAGAGHGGHAHDHGAEKQAPQAADAPEKEIKLQTTCPVMGGAINKDLYVDHDGKRIYVCCQGCVAEVGKNPAKTIQTMEAAGVALHKAGKADQAAEPQKPATGHEGHRH